MNEYSRRGLLGSAAMLVGVSVAGCQTLDDNDTPDAEEAVTATVDDDESDSTIYAGRSISELPDSLDHSAFGITGHGIYQFGDTDDGWRHIRYGSSNDSVPMLNAMQVTVGASPTGRPLISNGDRTIYVDPNDGDDSAAGTEDEPMATIQEAVQRTPIYLRDQYTIDLASVPDTPVTYDEDVLVPSVIGTGQAGQEVEAPSPGPFMNLVLRGEQDSPSAVEIGSLVFGNIIGTATSDVRHVTITRDSPYDDDNYGLSVYGVGEVKLNDIRFTAGPTNGVQVYGARAKVRNVDFGQENLGVGFKAKRHGSAMIHESRGALTRDAFRATGNSMISVLENVTVTGMPLFNTLRGGLIYDGDSDSWVGISGNRNVAPDANPQRPSRESSGSFSDHPDDATPGEIWYIDGSGEITEGFYGQAEEGPIRIR